MITLINNINKNERQDKYMNTYGIQLYSLRDISDKDLRGTLKKVSEMGYKTVEFAGFFDNKAEDVRSWLDEYGLTAIGTHTGWQLLENDFDGTVAYHKAIGCSDIIIPYAPHSNKAEIDSFVEKVNAWIPLLKKEGIKLHYHNHATEFKPNADGLIMEDELAKRTDILLEVDTYWAYVAGKDPANVLDKLGDRVELIHLKDGDSNGKGCSLGLGSAPVSDVLKKALATGRGIIVESEGLEPTGEEEVARCMEYLKKAD